MTQVGDRVTLEPKEIMLLGQVIAWVRDVVGGPHPRKPSKPICPLAERSVSEDLMRVEWHRGIVDATSSASAVHAAVFTLSQQVAADHYRSVMLVFPNLTEVSVDEVRTATHDAVVAEGLMQGYFGWPDSPYDDIGYPCPPVPCVVLRPLDVHDVALFMRPDAYRPARLRGYVKLFAGDFISGAVADTKLRRVLAAAAANKADVVAAGCEDAGADYEALLRALGVTPR